MKYAVINTTGLVVSTGTQIDIIHAIADSGHRGEIKAVPDDVSVEPMMAYWDGQQFLPTPPRPGNWAEWEGSDWVDPRTSEELEAAFEAYRAEALRRLTALRGRARLAYITDLPGQDMLYIAKAEEAAGYLSDPEPDPAQYPLIQSEVGVTAPTAYEVAQIFSNLNMLWRHAAGSIDAACFQAEAAVQQAPDRETIDLMLANLEAAIT